MDLDRDPWYTACPKGDCNKKVRQEGDATSYAFRRYRGEMGLIHALIPSEEGEGFHVLHGKKSTEYDTPGDEC